MNIDGRKTILLVEDEALIAMAEARMLRKYGYEVITAFSGEGALEAIEKSLDIDLVLMDINLGRGMDGTRIAEIILEKRDLPLIFMSSHTEREVLEKTEGITSYGYVAKDSGETVLVASIKMAFQLFEARWKERQKDEALSESERRLREMLENVRLVTVMLDVQGKITFCNDFLLELTGWGREEIIGRNWFELFVTPEQGVEQVFLAAIEQGTIPLYYENYILTRSGERRLIAWNNTMLRDPQGSVIGTAGIGEDITERVQAEQALRENERLLSEIAANYPNSYISIIERDLTVGFTSGREFKKRGLDPDHFIGLTLEQVFGDNAPLVRENYLRAFDGVETEFELFINGQYQLYRAIPLHDDSCQVERILVVVENITERKQAEQALSESHERLLAILDSIDADIYVADLESNEILFMNQHMRAGFGKGLIGKTCWSVFRGESGPCAHCTNDRLLDADGNPAGSVAWEGQNPLTGRWYINYDRAIKWVDDRLVRLQVAIDITEHKRAEQALRESEDRYRQLFEAESDAIFLIDNETGRIMEANGAAASMYGYSREELLAKRNTDLSAEPEETQRVTRLTPVVQEQVINIPLRLHRKKDGTVFPVEITGRFFGWQGRPAHIAAIRDITERMRTEDALGKALQDKQALLRELQHRAKNSFAMITGLIGLMADASEVDEVRAALGEIASRVVALAELYDLLYATDAVTEARLDEYCARITTSLDLSSNINFKCTYDVVTAPVKIAAPVGLIITELITNALKHAFPDGRRGTVAVMLRKTAAGAAIEIEDDGIGLPEDFSVAASDSLGFGLVQALVKQIGGRFSVERTGGARFVVEFPIEGNASR